jgi:hypothetical protein
LIPTTHPSDVRAVLGVPEEVGAVDERGLAILVHHELAGDFNRYGDRASLRTQPYDTDRWDRGQYGLGALGSREDYDRYGWGQGWSQDQGPYGYGPHRDELPEDSPRVRSSFTETERRGYATSPTRTWTGTRATAPTAAACRAPTPTPSDLPSYHVAREQPGQERRDEGRESRQDGGTLHS